MLHQKMVDFILNTKIFSEELVISDLHYGKIRMMYRNDTDSFQVESIEEITLDRTTHEPIALSYNGAIMRFGDVLLSDTPFIIVDDTQEKLRQRWRTCIDDIRVLFPHIDIDHANGNELLD